MKKSDLLRHKSNGSYAIIISDPWTKLFRDDSDWEAMHMGGGDYATAATAIHFKYMESGHEKIMMSSNVLKYFEIISEKNLTK